MVDCSKINPLLEIVASPVIVMKAPPVPTVFRPAHKATLPPDALFPLPAVITSTPARPMVAAAVPIIIWPLLSALAVPELKAR